MTPHYQVTQGCRIGGDVPQGRLWGAGIKCESAKVSKYKMQKCMRKYFRNLFTTQVPTACYKSVVLRLSGKLQNLFLIKRSCCRCVVVLPYTSIHAHALTRRRYVYSFWRDPRTWRTDGRTLRDSNDRACIASRGKNEKLIAQTLEQKML